MPQNIRTYPWRKAGRRRRGRRTALTFTHTPRQENLILLLLIPANPSSIMHIYAGWHGTILTPSPVFLNFVIGDCYKLCNQGIPDDLEFYRKQKFYEAIWNKEFGRYKSHELLYIIQRNFFARDWTLYKASFISPSLIIILCFPRAPISKHSILRGFFIYILSQSIGFQRCY